MRKPSSDVRGVGSPRSVRASDLDRLGRWAETRGLRPVAADVLPGGAYRLHFVSPDDATGVVDLKQDERAWDEVLRS